MKLLKEETYKSLEIQIKALELERDNWKAKATAKPQESENTKKEDFKHIYTDKKGNKYFECEVAKLPRSRQIYLTTILNQMALGLDVETLSELVREGMQQARNGSFENTIRTFSNIETRARNLCTPTLLFQAALVCIFLEGEPTHYNAEWKQKKIDLWKSDEDARFFFTHWAMTTIRGFSDISLDDFKRWVIAKEIEEPINLPNSI